MIPTADQKHTIQTQHISHKRKQIVLAASSLLQSTDNFYLRRKQRAENQTMKLMTNNNTSRFTSLEDSIDEESMTWQDDAVSLTNDSNELLPHLTITKQRFHTVHDSSNSLVFVVNTYYKNVNKGPGSPLPTPASR